MNEKRLSKTWGSKVEIDQNCYRIWSDDMEDFSVLLTPKEARRLAKFINQHEG
jgi:hypothetical protein